MLEDSKATVLRSVHSVGSVRNRAALLAVVTWIGLHVASALAQQVDQPQIPACLVGGRSFADEVWAKVGERICLKCHQVNGDARESGFLLVSDELRYDAATASANCGQFEKMALQTEGDESRLLTKATGGLDHGGGQVVKPDSPEYQILARFVRRLRERTSEPLEVQSEPESNAIEHDLFDGVSMVSPRQLLRRLTLSLAGRLPTNVEVKSVETDGEVAIESVLDRIFKEQAFFDRLKEGFNDIFLTIGIEDNAETLLSYDHFEKTRYWIEHFNLDHLPEEHRERARWKLADIYRAALLQEPLELIAYIVRNNRPFTELVTADYIMVSPYTARGYGIFDSVQSQFRNINDPFEYIPTRLPALKNRAGEVQESPTGYYPHAGILSMFHYLRRYPTTDTNRNRLRARMVYQHLLGIDVMQIAPRVMDAAAVSAKYKVPTMEAADCVVCHKVIDPVAGLFQDFNMEGHLGPRKEGWYTDMFEAGLDQEKMPPSERWRAIPWLGERIAKDPRFATAMVEHVYYIMMGRKVLQPPADIDDPTFLAKRRAYQSQRRMIAEIAKQFVESNFNLKTVFKSIAMSQFYRADAVAVPLEDPQRRAELDEIGLVRLLSPEQLNRKVEAIFGAPWKGLNDESKVLYGGIDSITVTERNTEPSGAMGAIQRLMANELACEHVALDFRRVPSERKLFPAIDLHVVPGTEDSNRKIKETIVHLHDRLLGQYLGLDDPEVTRTFELFVGVIQDAKKQKEFNPNETYFCGGGEEFQVSDPNYTHRAWRAVVTYLIRQHAFLYE